MANDKDIRIGIKTTADTSGIRATEEAIDRMKEAADEAAEAGPSSIFGEVDEAERQRMMDDLEQVRTGQAAASEAAERATTAQADGMTQLLRSAAVAGTAVSAVYTTLKGVFGAVQAQYDELAETDPEFAAKTEAMGVAIRTLADPVWGLKTAWDTVTTSILESLDSIALGGSVAAVRNAVAAQQMAVEMEAAFERAKQAHADMAASMRADAVGQLLTFQDQQARLFVEGLRNEQRVRDALSARSTAGAGTDAERVFLELQNQFDQSQTSNQIAEFAVAEAERKLAEAIANVQAQDGPGREAEQAMARQAEIVAAANLASAEAAYATQLRETEIQFGETLRASEAELRDRQHDAVTTSAAETLATLQAAAAEAGGNISSSMREAIAGLEKILADGVVKPEEMARLTEAMARIRASREGADSEILQGLNSLAATTQAVLTELPAVSARIRALEAQMKTISLKK